MRNSQATLQVSAPPGMEEIRAQVEKILASRLFSRSDRLIRFLRFSVEQALAGNGDQLKEQLIGIEVFDRKPDYDPRIDPIVRVEARRLRAKLKAYYTSPGRSDGLLIGFPKGTYVPVFRCRSSAPAVARSEPVAQPDGERSIVVLPFANLTPAAGDDYFSDGLTEELIYLLTRIPRLRVVAWNTASQLRGREQDLAGIRQQLKVGTVLRGSVRRTPSRIRVTAQLIDTETGAYLWSEAYDRELQNVLAIQEEMAGAIVNTLQLKLTRQGVHSARRTPNLQCYNLCLQGRFHANKRTREGLHQSVHCYEQAIAADATCAEAYAGLADAYSLLADHSFLEPSDAAARARSAAEKALALDPESGEAHVSLAFIRALFDWEWADAEALYHKAIALNPGYSRAHHWYAIDFLAIQGRLDEALSEARLARHLDPLSQITVEGCGYVHMMRRDYWIALEEYRQLIALDPLFYRAYSSMGRVLSLMGRYDDAIAAFEKARALEGDAPKILSALGQTLALAGFTWEARALLDQLHAMAGGQWVSPVCFAIVHLGLGDHQSALTHLEAACDQRELAVAALKVHPLYDPLRSEPRFQRLLERIHLLP
jgi:TolB-like protein/tetratricopeptide (TPR) repeat protein